MQCGKSEIYTYYLVVYTLNMSLHFSTAEFNLIMIIAFLLMKKKTILLLPDNLIISLSFLPQGKIIDHHRMGENLVQVLPCNPSLDSLGDAIPLSLNVGLALLMGLVDICSHDPSPPSAEAGTVHSVPTSF